MSSKKTYKGSDYHSRILLKFTFLVRPLHFLLLKVFFQRHGKKIWLFLVVSSWVHFRSTFSIKSFLNYPNSLISSLAKFLLLLYLLSSLLHFFTYTETRTTKAQYKLHFNYNYINTATYITTHWTNLPFFWEKKNFKFLVIKVE